MNEEDKQYKEKMKNTVNKFSEAAKDKAKKEIIKKIVTVLGAKGIAILILVVLASSILATVFLAAAVYFNDLDTKAKAATVKEKAIGNEALNTVLAMEDGKYKIKYKNKDGKEVTGKEAIKSILEDNDINFEDFSDEEIECLYKCLKAEWATTYPNLGEDVDNTDIDSEDIQGVITIKRGKTDGNIINLTYKPYEDFTNIKDEKALNYFSIKDGNIIVANWSSIETKYEIDGDMPDDIKEQYKNTGEQINITETSINYRNMIGIHTIPFELVLSLLINTEDTDFVNDLADLAFDSTIELTVYDDTKVITTKVKEHTNEKTTYNDFANYYIKTTTKEILADGKNKGHYASSNGEKKEEIVQSKEETVDYTIKTTTTTEDNSYVVGLTNASSWLGIIENEYTYKPIEGEEENLDLGAPQTYNNKKEEELDINDTNIVAFAKSKNKVEKTKRSYNQSTHITEEECIVTKAREEINTDGLYEIVENTSKTDEYKYDKGTKVTKDIGVKFKEVYDKHSKARAQLDCVSSWLFEMLEDTESTVDYVSIMKYLLYVCTEVDYGVSEEDLNNILDVMGIQSGNSFTGIFYGNSAEEVVWFALKDLGYSEYAIAGVMGNIYGESGFNPAAVESNGEGIGLCQWSYGRKKQLIEYANSKGKEWSDLNTQIEFLITEIEGTGLASGYATPQMQYKYKGYTKNDWKNAQDIDTATTAFCYVFERPGIPRLDTRINKSNKYYNSFKGKEAPARGNYTGTEGEKLCEAAQVILEHTTKCRYSYNVSVPNYSEGVSSLWNKRGVCCASYVAWILVESGVVSEDYINSLAFRGATSLGEGLKKIFPTVKVKNQNDLQKGDIVVWPGHHVQMYAGNGYWYNGGAAGSIPPVKYSQYDALSYFKSYGSYYVLRPVQQ